MFKITNFQYKTAAKKIRRKAGDSTSVESIRQIHPFFAKQSQITHQKSEYRRQNTEDKNVYKCLSNKEIRSANSLDVSQDVIHRMPYGGEWKNQKYAACFDEIKSCY